jgi:3-oxoacyl-[acyl-carrier protein] reductase
MIRRVETELGSIDVLVNNAAYCPSGPITSYTSEEWEKTFAINVTGMFVASRELIKKWLAAEKQACIVNIASQAAFRGSTTGHLPYDSSKGAMISFTDGLAREVARQGIRVNAIAPGLVRTEMVAETWEKKKEKYLERIPLYRIAEPEEIARVAVFLASSAASYITGATIDASGGMVMR